MRLALSLFAAVVCCAFADDADPVDPKIKPREIMVAGAGKLGGKPTENKYTTAADLATAYGKDVADAVAKEVDFKKEYVVVFSWSGSGGDRITLSSEGKKATFSKNRGLTRDLRSHFKVFALPKGFTYESK